MSNLIYIMGKSSAGKDTIYQKVKERIETNLYIPYTTRPMREGEIQGREYNFITREEFNKLANEQKVMENRNYNVINKNGKTDIWTYATIADNQWKKDGDFLSIGTLESYINILEYLKKHPEKNLKMVPVYICINEAERRKRATERENKQEKPNFEEMERRLKADNIDFSEEKLKEAGISKFETFENYDLEKCVNEIIEYIQRKRQKDVRIAEREER